ncbi:hypothetical protein ABID22_000127 [Pontibacter aydingkolensis]|uniref:Uncharacterized protein n=1 Tax=Pontibacter aydingkolensis TaxID=1911536 RepID=A0ABS7CQU4_9BACT|nr:hypothetical protein [Pontibacter aydingkolensis]MBW7466205.1 hypothetical protein [Pontibacter aydingkolensis]
MALVKQTLEMQVLNLLTDLSKRTENPQQANQDFARELATIIDNYIKSATVTVTVATTGTAAAQTGTGTGNLS